MSFTHLLFDLDNTLYPSSSEMDAGISKRMLECVAKFLNCDIETAIKLRHENVGNFSTTLEWLRSLGFTEIENFLAYVHPENEADELQEQPGLREFLLKLPYKKSILTNAPYEHAQRVLNKLNIQDIFETITDIRDCNFFGKPYPQSFETALKKMNAEISQTLFLDDIQRYTAGWCALGGTAILIGEKNGEPLSSQSKILKNSDKKNGKQFRLKSIYELPDFLKNN